MSRLVCFIDKTTGQCGTCSMEANGKEIDCKKCSFMKQFKGKEREHYSYTRWTGELKNEVVCELCGKLKEEGKRMNRHHINYENKKTT